MSPWQRWIVFAAAGRKGYCLRSTCDWCRLEILNCLVISKIGVQVLSSLFVYKCAYSLRWLLPMLVCGKDTQIILGLLELVTL